MTTTNKLLVVLIGLVALVAVGLGLSALKGGDSPETYRLRVTTESTCPPYRVFGPDGRVVC